MSGVDSTLAESAGRCERAGCCAGSALLFDMTAFYGRQSAAVISSCPAVPLLFRAAVRLLFCYCSVAVIQ